METNNEFANEIVEKIKALVKEGNVAKINIWHNGEKKASFPVNAGLIGGVLMAAAAPWALVVAAIAAVGTKCCVEVEKKDGSVINIYGNH